MKRTIYTYSGRLIDVLDPRPADIAPEDIAHALACTCRFNGHSREFYSVAQHSILVAEICGHPWGLLHDAAEAYMGDIVRPLKGCLALANERYLERWQSVEDRLLGVIANRFRVKGFPDEDRLEEADNQALATEIRDLIDPRAECLAGELARLPDPLPEPICPWIPCHAELEYRRALRLAFPEVCS
jgi:hypothetical protein